MARLWRAVGVCEGAAQSAIVIHYHFPVIQLIVLGTAQDAGVPQLGCNCERCQRARHDARFARWVACLGLIDTDARQTFLIDATPDIRPQLEYLLQRTNLAGRDGPNLIDGVILTHAHIGHYTGLVQFGKEVMAKRQLPTYCTERMASFLRSNGPWAQLVRDEHITLSILTDNQNVRLTNELTLRPFLVPHRQEWSDTIGLEIIGPHKCVLYIPDIDRWSDWNCDVRAAVSQCDLALLDGTFFSGDELPGRDMSSVPHPHITDSMERLAGLGGVHFTHFNHTNPALDSNSPQFKEIQARGFHIAEDKMEFQL